MWLLVTLIPCAMKFGRDDSYNNFLIYRDSFLHAIQLLPLYTSYPPLDLFLYGITFTAIIAPFTIFPPYVGMILWCTANSLLLYYAISKLNLTGSKFAAIIWLVGNELFTCVLMQQYNIAVAGMTISAFALIERKHDFWAAMIIVLGTITKVYCIVGLAFFLFSRRKGVFIASLIFWGVLFFGLPMLYTSPEYVIVQYQDWIKTLVMKNNINMFASHTNISLLGMVRKISGNHLYNDLLILIPAMLLSVTPYLRIKQYPNYQFRILCLALLLLSYVLFSTGSENSSYIGAMVAVGLWYIETPTRHTTPKLNMVLLIFCFLLTSLSPTDIIPSYIRKAYIIPYALKALPCTIIWVKIIWELLTVD
ncbi:MAG: glycosyltransferase family 87 protein, partial [Rikenellaceae bacterium]